MSLGDFFDGLRRKPPEGGGSGSCRTTAGESVELELYKMDGCPFCQRVFRVVKRLRVPLRYRDVARDDDDARKLVEVGGLDQVPCLFIDGKPLYESADIVAYLERNFGSARG